MDEISSRSSSIPHCWAILSFKRNRDTPLEKERTWYEPTPKMSLSVTTHVETAQQCLPSLKNLTVTSSFEGWLLFSSSRDDFLAALHQSSSSSGCNGSKSSWTPSAVMSSMVSLESTICQSAKWICWQIDWLTDRLSTAGWHANFNFRLPWCFNETLGKEMPAGVKFLTYWNTKKYRENVLLMLPLLGGVEGPVKEGID